MITLWASDEPEWQHALERYDAVIKAQGSERLAELDQWYRMRLPAEIRAGATPRITREQLVETTRWKMLRGVWR